MLWEETVQSYLDDMLGKGRIQIKQLLGYNFDHATRANDFYGYEMNI